MGVRSGPVDGMDERVLAELSPRGMVRSFPKSAVVVTEGDATDSLCTASGFLDTQERSQHQPAAAAVAARVAPGPVT